MNKQEMIQEHKRLIKVLMSGDKIACAKEAKLQKEDLMELTEKENEDEEND